MRNYSEFREYLLNMGFKCIDMDYNGNEIFEHKDKFDVFRFAVVEGD